MASNNTPSKFASKRKLRAIEAGNAEDAAPPKMYPIAELAESFSEKK
jgi:hypothetical protein